MQRWMYASYAYGGWGSKNKPQLTTFSCTAEPKHFSFVSLTHWLTSAAMSSTQVMIHQHIAAEIECGERVQRESRESARSLLASGKLAVSACLDLLYRFRVQSDVRYA